MPASRCASAAYLSVYVYSSKISQCGYATLDCLADHGDSSSPCSSRHESYVRSGISVVARVYGFTHAFQPCFSIHAEVGGCDMFAILHPTTTQSAGGLKSREFSFAFIVRHDWSYHHFSPTRIMFLTAHPRFPSPSLRLLFSSSLVLHAP